MIYREEVRVMGRTSGYVPTIEDGALLLDSPAGRERARVAVGSDAWFAWLASARGFIFRGPAGRFTARKRQREQGDFWYAFRRLAGHFHEIYLGKGQDLTVQRLNTAAAKLNQLIGRTPAQRTQPPGDGPERAGPEE